MKLPFIIIFDLDVIIGDTSFILNEYHLLNIIHMNCKIDNILNSCIDKYDLTEELESGLLRPNFKDFIEFVKNKYKTVEFYCIFDNDNKYDLNIIVDRIEKYSNIKFNKPYFNNNNNNNDTDTDNEDDNKIILSNLYDIIINDLISKYQSLKSQKNKEYVFNNQILYIDYIAENIKDFPQKQILCPKYNYKLYYEHNFKIYENDIIYQSILNLIMEKYSEITIKHMNDNFFNNLIAILKKDKNLIIDNNKIKTINEKLF